MGGAVVGAHPEVVFRGPAGHRCPTMRTEYPRRFATHADPGRYRRIVQICQNGAYCGQRPDASVISGDRQITGENSDGLDGGHVLATRAGLNCL